MSYQYFQPTNGSTVSVSATPGDVILDPAANSTPFTVDLPASPSDGDKYSFRISKLSCNVGFQSTDGSTVDDGSSGFGFSPVQSASFLYRSANTTWYRGN